MTDTSPRDLIQQLVDEFEGWIVHAEIEDIERAHDLVDEARAYLAQPETEGPTEEEILELSGEHFDYRGDSMGGWFIPISIGPTIELSSQVHAFARAVLARWGK